MRQPTKRRTYGKAAMAQALRSARLELITALGQMSDVEPQEVSAMRRVATDLTNALKAYDTYGMQAKRLRAALEELREQVEARIADVMGLAITPEEKTIARHKKLEEKDVALKAGPRAKKPKEEAKQKPKVKVGKPALGRQVRPTKRRAEAKKHQPSRPNRPRARAQDGPVAAE